MRLPPSGADQRGRDGLPVLGGDLHLYWAALSSGIRARRGTCPDSHPRADCHPYQPTPLPTRQPTATSDLPAAPLPGIIGIGSSVQISGTDGSGLNIREQAGLGGKVRFVALDSEVFEIRDGPVEADDFTWWYLVTPHDENRTGWAAANFLSLVLPEE